MLQTAKDRLGDDYPGRDYLLRLIVVIGDLLVDALIQPPAAQSLAAITDVIHGQADQAIIFLITLGVFQ